MVISIKEETLAIKNSVINLNNTFFCGQCFRWKQLSEGLYRAVVNGEILTVKRNLGDIFFYRESNLDVLSEETVKNYFDVSTNYDFILKNICEKSKFLEDAVKFSPGIIILKQDSWETLCSFIISQNNNIPRIKGIIERLCTNFGEKIKDGFYSFPLSETISKLNEGDLLPIRSGFRAKYIIDAARKVSLGEVDLLKIKNLPTELARLELMKIKGVGEKVADCTLLYGYHRLEVVPKDIWIKRVILSFFPGVEDLQEIFGDFAGLAQIYLFNYVRHNIDILSGKELLNKRGD